MTPPLSSSSSTEGAADERPRHQTDPSIARLVAPLSPAEFFAKVWEQRPVHLHRHDTFADLFTLADLDAVLSYAEADVGAVRTEHGVPRVFDVDRIRNTPNVHSLVHAWQQGYTIGAKFLHRYWPPFVRLCQQIETALHHQAGVNLYFSPPHAQGFSHHRDGHDVFILQSHGEKRWRIYAPPVPLCRSSAYYPDPDTLGAPIVECELREGEGLYIPRGCPHVAMSGDRSSLHLTVAIQPTTPADLLRTVIERLSARDLRFRRALPPGWHGGPTHERHHLAPALRPLLDALSDALGDETNDGPLVDATCDEFRRQRWATMQPAADGQFARLARADAIGPRTLLQRRDGMNCEVTTELTTATVHFPGRALVLPLRYLRALRHVATHQRIRARDLPGIELAEERVELARTLVREGLLSPEHLDQRRD